MMKVSKSANMTYPRERVKRVWACEPTQQELYDFGCRAGCRCCEGEASPFPRSGPADGLFPCWIGHSQRASRSRVVSQSAMKVQWRSSSEPQHLFGIGTPPNSTAPVLQGMCRTDAVPSRKDPSTGSWGPDRS